MVIFDELLSKDTVSQFVIGCEELLKENKVIDIYFTTSGGYTDIIAPVVKYIIDNSDRINFYITHTMSSSGFSVLLNLVTNDVPVFMSPTFSHCTIHRSMYSDRVHLDVTKESDSYNKKELKLIKNFLSKKERKLIERGGDVIIRRKRLLKMFPEIIKVNYNGYPRES